MEDENQNLGIHECSWEEMNGQWVVKVCPRSVSVVAHSGVLQSSPCHCGVNCSDISGADRRAGAD